MIFFLIFIFYFLCDFVSSSDVTETCLMRSSRSVMISVQTTSSEKGFRSANVRRFSKESRTLSDGNCIHSTRLKHNQSFLQQCIDLIHLTQPGLCIWSLDLFVLQFSCTRYIDLRRISFSVTIPQTLTGGSF